MLLHILQGMDQPLTTKNYLAPNVNTTKVSTILKESELETFPKNIDTKCFMESLKQVGNIAQR